MLPTIFPRDILSLGYNSMRPCYCQFHLYTRSTLESEMCHDFLVVRNMAKLSAKFLLGASTAIEKVELLLYFVSFAKTTVRIRLKIDSL